MGDSCEFDLDRRFPIQLVLILSKLSSLEAYAQVRGRVRSEPSERQLRAATRPESAVARSCWGGERLKGGTGSKNLFFPGNIEGPGGEIASLLSCNDTRLTLIESVLRIPNLNADLLSELLRPELGLARLELGAVLVRLCDAIPERYVEGDSYPVVWSGVVESAVECATVAERGCGGHV